MQASVQGSEYSLLPIYEERINLGEVDGKREVQNQALEKTGFKVGEVFQQNTKRFEERKASQDTINNVVLVPPIGGTLIGIALFSAGLTDLGKLFTAGLITACASIAALGFSALWQYSVMKKYEESSSETSAVENFYNLFVEFKLNPFDHSVPNLFTLFEAMDGDWHERIEQSGYNFHLKIFKSKGKVLLMHAVSAILLQKNEKSDLAKAWKNAIQTNTLTSYQDFWGNLGITAPSVEAYLEANAEIDSFKFESFHEHIKDKFEQNIKTALDLGLL